MDTNIHYRDTAWFDCELTVEDDDRRIEFHLRVQGNSRPGQRGRSGWSDGGDPGEFPSWELFRTWCLALRVASGTRSVQAEVNNPADQRRIGDWCSREYGDEIRRELARMVPG